MATPMETKQHALVAEISKTVVTELGPEFAAMAKALAALAVDLKAMHARLAILDAVGTSATGKRPVRTVGAKAGGAAAPVGDGFETCTNALIYMRTICSRNIGNTRERYCTTERMEAASTDEAVMKKNIETDPAGYYSAVGAYIWKSSSKESKDGIRAEYVAWKEKRTRDAAAPFHEEEADVVVDPSE